MGKPRAPIPRMASVDTLFALAIAGVDGRNWYAAAREDIRVIAERFDETPSHVASVLAVTSPRISVRVNARMTLRYLNNGDRTGMTRSVRASLEHYEDHGEIRGPKTEAFAANLSGDESRVVLDIWMCRALGIEQAALVRPAVYAAAAERVRRVAVRLGWTPAQTQAAIWTAAYRRHYAVPNVPRLPLLEEAHTLGILLQGR